MTIKIVGRRYNVSQALEKRVNLKIGKLSKFFGDEADVTVVLSKEKERNIAEATIHHKGIIYRAEEAAGDMYSSIDRVSEVLERQIRKNRTRLEKKLKESAFVPDVNDLPFEVDEEPDFDVVKTKKIAVKPMPCDEAILQMNLLGHLFFVFKNADTNEPNVVYKRNSGGYGLIEVE